MDDTQPSQEFDDSKMEESSKASAAGGVSDGATPGTAVDADAAAEAAEGESPTKPAAVPSATVSAPHLSATGTLEDADSNTLRVMLSTDNHLGYNERDPVRGMDSFAAFEEVLYLAKYTYKCDLVLLSGDLFHENRPSRRTLMMTMEIMRRYCMGPNPVQIQLLSDAKKNFRNLTNVNYQEENYSVDLPVFSIHGNHDDPSRDAGGELLAALDLLSIANFVNYFGRQDQVEKIEISPILLQKGDTKVALYGLGSMRDERLNRMWNSKKVRFLRPEEDSGPNSEGDEEGDSFFNIFTLHQNRDLGRGSKNCVQESMIPEWMDLVVWGHEHECLIDFFESVVGTFRITQPGSSVATSLVPGEAVTKQVGILDIQGKNFRMHTVPLTQVRGFVCTEINLKEHRANLDPEDPKIEEKMTKALEEEVSMLIHGGRDKYKSILEQARKLGNAAAEKVDNVNTTSGDIPQLKYKLKLPDHVLVRVRVDHSGFEAMSNQRFGARFVGEVANPTDILLFSRRKGKGEIKSASEAITRTITSGEPIAPESLEQTNMEDLVMEYLEAEAPGRKMKLLNKKRLSEALEEYVDKNTISTIMDTTSSMLKEAQKKMIADSHAAALAGDDSSMDKASKIREMIEMDTKVLEDMDLADRRKRAEEARRSAEQELAARIGGDEGGHKKAFKSRVGDSAVQDVDDLSVHGSRKNKRDLYEDDDDDVEEVSLRGSEMGKKYDSLDKPGKKSAKMASNSAAAKRRQQLMADDSDDSDVVVMATKPPKKATANAAPAKRGRPAATKTPLTKKKMSGKIMASPPSSNRPKRATVKGKSYAFDEVSSGSDDYIRVDDDNSVEEIPPTKKRAAASPPSSKRGRPKKGDTSEYTRDSSVGSGGRWKNASGNKRGKSSVGNGSRGRGSRMGDSDDEAGGGFKPGSAVLDEDDWGTAATKSQS